MTDCRDALLADLVEQFRDRPKLKVLLDAVGRQLNEVKTFFEDLGSKRDLKTAEGAQLDGIGDIVVLSRYEAGVLALAAESVYVLQDEPYRDYLIYKIWKNTNSCTYWDIMKGLRIFWDRPLYYREDPEHPACIIFDTGEMEGFVDTRRLMSMPLIKSAGVGLRLYAITRTEMPVCTLTLRGGFMRVTEDLLPFIEREFDWTAAAALRSGFMRVAEDGLPYLERELDLAGRTQAGGAMYSIMETAVGDAENLQ